MAAVAELAAAKTHTIQWSLNGNYGDWSASNTVNVGDTVVFTYGPPHTVDELTQAEYTACHLRPHGVKGQQREHLHHVRRARHQVLRVRPRGRTATRARRWPSPSPTWPRRRPTRGTWPPGSRRSWRSDSALEEPCSPPSDRSSSSSRPVTVYYRC
ncbi:hypothetical protein HU200_064263 [Digitaria exilis]|uniref:Phytocyanin domain-containing protein n=1 Tax=Digitaria exilis TaxID=1010633 RepID=A0A835A288_9POAL|nr:hypothetical protein HU200_064263 [Digitaria exilis]